MRKYIAICLAAIITACSSKSVPKDIIQPNKMKAIVYDMVRADEFTNNYVLRDTSLKSKEQHIKMYEQVFLIHKTNKTDFYKSFRYYQEHPAANKVLFDSLLSFTNSQRAKLYESKSDTLKK